MKAPRSAARVVRLAVVVSVSTLLAGVSALEITGWSPYRSISIIDYVDEFSRPDRLVEYVDDVFVGTVLQPAGGVGGDFFPMTAYLVQVQERLAGDLTGTIVVAQVGGRRLFGLERHTVHGSEPWVAGRSYLFATRGWPAPGGVTWHRTHTPYGEIALRSPDQRAAVLQAFRKALMCPRPRLERPPAGRSRYGHLCLVDSGQTFS